MTADIILVLAIVAVAIVLFVTEWVRYDMIALLVLVTLAVTGTVPGLEAIQGFGDPAVVTIAAVLVLSGGLYRTGVANLLGRQMLRLAGASPARITLVVMMTAGLLSGIMNNIAVGALLLPVVLDIARRIGQPPSRLMIPLAFATLLGGLTTLIGTAPNILIAGALFEAGLEPFDMFDFTPLGLTVLVAGTLCMVLLGGRLLPHRWEEGAGDSVDAELRGQYEIEEMLFTIAVPQASGLAGRSLVDCRLGLALGLSVLAVRREGRMILAPRPSFKLREGDRVVAAGRPEAFETLRGWGHFIEPGGELPSTGQLVSGPVGLAEMEVASDSALAGQTLREIDFRNRYRTHVVAIAREGAIRRARIHETRLKVGDVLVVLGTSDRLQQLRYASEFCNIRRLTSEEATQRYQLSRWLLRLEVPSGSLLEGRTLKETRLRRAFDLAVLEIQRDGEGVVLPGPATQLKAGDVLVVEGRRDNFLVLDALVDLELKPSAPRVRDLESEKVGFAELTLAPRATLAGKSLKEVFFREKYGLSVLAIWRGGRSYHSSVEVRSMPLRFGDALLVYGERTRLRLLARDPGFLVLTEEMREIFRGPKAPVALAIMAAVVLSASTALLPIYIAAPAGALMMVFTGCLTADEAYEAVQWKVILLIGGMLALGVAMQETGTAGLIARSALGRAAEIGPLALLGGLFMVTALAAQFIPTAAVAVLMSPIALNTAVEAGVSPYSLMMVVAVGASAAFLSPFGHPVNLLVMGVGGYRVADYTKVGIPLVIVLLLVVLFVLPIIWPLAI
jgi:di/tricarboxylate transporter